MTQLFPTACPGRLAVAFLCAALVLVALVSSGCQTGISSEPQGPPAAENAAPLRVALTRAELQPWPWVVRVQGSLMGDERAVIGAKVAGRIREVAVDMGSVVQAGDLLATLETEEFDLRVQQAAAELEQARVNLGLQPGENEAQLDRAATPAVMQEKALLSQARANLARAQSLAPQRIITAEELGQRQAEVEVAEAKCRSALNAVEEQLALIGVRRTELALAKQARIDAEIRAPFAGLVQQRHVAPGTYVQIGQPVATVVRTDPLRFHAGVPERQATQLRAKQTARVRIEGDAEPLAGTVTRISPALEMSNRALQIEIDVPNPGHRLRVGLFAEAEIVVDPAAQALTIPAAAVREFAGVEKVWVVRDGQAAEQAIVTGRRAAERVEVLRGLDTGDQIVSRAEQGRAGPVVAEMPAPKAGQAAAVATDK